MAYDLLLRRSVPKNIARGESPPAPRGEGLHLVLASAVVLLPQVVSSVRTARVREELRDDDASVTREMPAVSNRDLMARMESWKYMS